MAGWFRKKINTIGDFKGLRMRIPNLGGQVVSRAGGTTVLTPAASIFAELERGVIDASEFVGPHDDMIIGLHKTAHYYYYPGLARAGDRERLRFHKKAYEALPVRLTTDPGPRGGRNPGVSRSRAITRRTPIALERLKTEFKGKVEISPASGAGACGSSGSIRPRWSRRNPRNRRWPARCTPPSRSFKRFVGLWDHVAEGAYHQLCRGS
jgi:hypothetical protein